MSKEFDEWFLGLDFNNERMGDVHYAEGCVRQLYGLLCEKHGPFVTRGLFNLYAPPLTKSDKRLADNVSLFLRLIQMKPKLNVRQLAAQLAKETGKDQGSLEKKIERASKSRKVQNSVWSTLFDITCEEPDTTYWPKPTED
jgi:hypothetical protein